MPFDLPFERLYGGHPLIAPTDNWWESGVTFNSAAVILAPTPENLAAFRALLGPDEAPREIVVLHYRARPKCDPGYNWTRSFVGVSVHEPDLTLIRRFETPILEPGGSTCDPDFLGVEDPRVAWLDGSWWMVYCGVAPITVADPLQTWRGSVCLAKSEDLVHWEKLGPVAGSGFGFGDRESEESVSNKDGVFFPERIDDKVFMLHRPMIGDIGTWCVNIATADKPDGFFTDLGAVHGAMSSREYYKSWVGGGSVPIKIGEGRYVSLEHTGNYYEDKTRKYVLDAFLYDFNTWDPEHPETLVAARLDDVMRPETPFEVRGPYEDSVANVVFVCGSYVHDGWIYVVYGGGDTFILSARIRFGILVEALEEQAQVDRTEYLARVG